jgi:biotin operon repressor
MRLLQKIIPRQDVGLALKITRKALANETHSYQDLGYPVFVANEGLS